MEVSMLTKLVAFWKGSTRFLQKLFITTIFLLLGTVLIAMYITDSQTNAHMGPLSVRLYNREMPLIFISGQRHSGLAKISSIFNTHPNLRVGPMTHLVPIVLKAVEAYKKEHKIEDPAQNEDWDRGVSSFCLNLIAKNKFVPSDTKLILAVPYILSNAEYLRKLYPNSKFILMLRDGRAIATSWAQKRQQEKNVTAILSRLKDWNNFIVPLVNGCVKMGPELCQLIFYESFVRNPISALQEICEFMNIPSIFDKLFPRMNNFTVFGKAHQTLIGSEIKVTLPVEETLMEWKKAIKPEVCLSLSKMFPVLKQLGYDESSCPKAE